MRFTNAFLPVGGLDVTVVAAGAEAQPAQFDAGFAQRHLVRGGARHRWDRRRRRFRPSAHGESSAVPASAVEVLKKLAAIQSVTVLTRLFHGNFLFDLRL